MAFLVGAVFVSTTTAGAVEVKRLHAEITVSL
jgi:hypothetical protein